jgi:hypothetical protein
MRVCNDSRQLRERQFVNDETEIPFAGTKKPQSRRSVAKYKNFFGFSDLEVKPVVDREKQIEEGYM